MSVELPVIGIAGFGIEGKALYAYFKNKANIHLFNEKELDVIPEGVTFHLGYSIPAFIPVLYKSPGIPAREVKLESLTTKISTLMDLVLERVGSRAIGITGTKGKSTVTSLIAHILEKTGHRVVTFGNIGIADMSLLEQDAPNTLYVIELSSYQCEYLSHSPHIAILTNFFPEHLRHHGTLDRYREAKVRIGGFQSETDFFINGSNVEVTTKATLLRPVLAKAFETALLGEHNQKNCAIAVAAVGILGVSEEEARAATASFKPLPYRLEKIATVGGRTFYDDSLATVPEATLASLEALGKVSTLILGGEDRGISFDSFAVALATTAVRTFIVFPDTGRKMVTHVQDRLLVPVTTMKEAVEAAYAHTEQGGVVLLSNASPSFNLFKDYKDKSAQYRAAIQTLGP